MHEKYQRTAMLIGEENIEKLRNSSILLFGVGGVGSFAAEALARAGVGRIGLCDNDTVSVSNINRQLVALESTVGKLKVDVMAERIADINPDTAVKTYPCFYNAETAGNFDFKEYDYIIDAIDTVTSKLLLIKTAKELEIPIISCMGTGNKLDPTALTVTDIKKTSGCPLAKVMRRELKNLGINSLKVVYSTEQPIKPLFQPDDAGQRRSTPGSVSFVPSVAGLIAAGEVVKDLTK